MVAIDLKKVSIRHANEMLRGYGATHQDVEILNPDACHYIGVGLISPITVRVKGSAGYFCGGLCDGPTFFIEGNASWGVGDNLLQGTIVVDGNASAVAGEGLRGGEIVVKGDLGSRAGQVMKKGTLCCAGSANFMAGYMMYGGRLIILGDSGERVGQDMMGGEIYVGGEVESVGTDAEVVDATPDDTNSVMDFLDRYGLSFNGTLKKIVCAGKLLKYSKQEPRSRRLPFHIFSGADATYWNAKLQEDVKVKSITGRYRIRGYGAARHLPHFPDIAFKVDLSDIEADPDVVSKVDLRTFIGDKHGGKALDLSMPLMIAPMSFGALSAGMKTALATASRLSGISENSGEGGMLSIARAEARQIIAQCLAGRLGWNIHDMNRADAVELYISQGAKPGLGGQLMAEKLTEELAAVRGIPAGMDLRSPSRHPDVLGGDDLIMKIAEFREATGGRAPVGLKLGAGRIRDDIKIALKDGLDFVELDGLQGGTGAAPDEVLEYVGIPTIAGLQEALEGLEEIDACGQLPIVIMGGVTDGVDAAKAIALGATAVGMGTAMLIAGGCITCMQCSVGSCVIGAATQKPGHTARVDVEEKALRMHHFLEAVRWQMAAVVHALGYDDIRQMSRNDLVALTPEAAEMLHLPYDPEYREKLRRRLGNAGTAGQGSRNEYHDPAYVPAPCQEGCPVGTDVPSYLGFIGQGEYVKAFEVLSANNPFSTVCGRVCSKPCEDACRRGDSDQAATIRGLKRFVAEKVGHDFALPPVSVTQSHSVGIVGAGPTGLTAAQDLAEAGYEVHLYERMDRPGGMMTAGIPPFRCPRSLLDEDINRIFKHCPGIKQHVNCTLGKDVALDELKERHAAVLLAVGLWQDRKLGIPGEQQGLKGLHGIDLLTDINSGKKIELKGKVVVVGGGNVALDMARTALRVGAEGVELFFLETRETMPAWEHEIQEAISEGINLTPCWGPKQILHDHEKVTGIEFMQCLSVFDSQGRFNPTYDSDAIQTVEADAILLAIGLAVGGPELESTGLVKDGRVAADATNTRTQDSKVFAAGDGASGPSAIVYAMHHGHKAAYYMQAFLAGEENPAPYHVPYSTAKAPLSTDPDWEKLPREEQVFLGLSENRALLTECDLTYDLEAASRQAARCMRCDAETGTAGYSRRTRDQIHDMAKTEPADTDKLQRIIRTRLAPRDNPFPPERPPHLDDLVFLAAAISRLVIDPYREDCTMATTIGKNVKLELPFIFSGFDKAPEAIRQALAGVLRATSCPYVGLRPLADDVTWLQLVVDGKSEPQAGADGLIYVVGPEFREIETRRMSEGQLLGLAVTSAVLRKAIPYALEKGLDLLLLDGAGGIESPADKQGEAFDLSVIRDTIKILRELNKEEEIALLYNGGLRTGTDVAKVLAMNCSAGIISTPMSLALGSSIDDGILHFPSDSNVEEAVEAGRNWIKATTQEAAVIGRCTGKTNVHNLEPEDMRAITLATSEAIGIPLAAGRGAREYF